MNSLNVLVTGAGGMVGKNLIETLDYKKHKITLVDNSVNALNSFLSEKNIINYFNVVDLDIRDFERCKKTIKDFDVVIHLAAIIDVPLSIKEPKLIMDVNYNGTLNVLESMRINRIKRIIFLSTQGVYGNNINSYENQLENLDPFEVYSLSKLLSENTCKMYSKISDMKYLILRSSYLYGKYQNKKFLIPLFLDRLSKYDTIEMGNDVSRDFLNVGDLTSFINKNLNFKRKDIFNIGTGKETRISELIHMISKSMGEEVDIKIEKRLIRGNKYERLREIANIDKITRTGWMPKIDIKEYLIKGLKNEK